MSNDPKAPAPARIRSINEIMRAAIAEVRDVHGLAVHSMRVDWMGTLSAPSSAISQVEFDGSVFAPKRRAE